MHMCINRDIRDELRPRLHFKLTTPVCPGTWAGVVNCRDPSDIAGHRYLRHYKLTHDPGQFDSHTNASIYEMVDDLAAKHGVLGVGAFRDLEKKYGVNYVPAGILMDAECRQWFTPRTGLVFDWAHCIVASGGAGQYHVASFCHALIEHNITLAMLDRFSRDVKTPGYDDHLRDNFFQSRVPTGAEGKDSHIKAYASECLGAINTLALFAKYVLGGPGPLRRHCDAFLVLFELTHICTLQDHAVQHATRLDELVRVHNQAVLSLYGQEVLKIKAHLMHHLGESMAFHRFNINCLTTERTHKEVKKIVSNICRGDRIASYAIERLLLRVLSDFDCGIDFKEFVPLGRVQPMGGLAHLLATCIGPCLDTKVFRALHTPLGKIRVDDCALVSLEGRPSVCMLRAFCLADRRIFVVVEVFRQGADPRQWRTTGLFRIARADCIVGLLQYLATPPGIFPLLSELHGQPS